MCVLSVFGTSFGMDVMNLYLDCWLLLEPFPPIIHIFSVGICQWLFDTIYHGFCIKLGSKSHGPSSLFAPLFDTFPSGILLEVPGFIWDPFWLHIGRPWHAFRKFELYLAPFCLWRCLGPICLSYTSRSINFDTVSLFPCRHRMTTVPL
jgi:hypothetical protein